MLAQVELALDEKYGHLYYVNITTGNYRDFRNYLHFLSNFLQDPTIVADQVNCFRGPGTASVIFYSVTDNMC